MSGYESNDRQFIRICETGEIRDGHGLGFRVGALDLAIFHSEGRFYATSDICSHEHEHLSDGWLEGNHVECPRHGAMFDLSNGEALSLPATDPIETFPLEVRGSEIWVGIPLEYLKTSPEHTRQ